MIDMKPENKIQDTRGFCPLCESLSTFIRDPGSDSELICSSCGSLPHQRAVYHIIKALFTDWTEMRQLKLKKNDYLPLALRAILTGRYDIIIFDYILGKNFSEECTISSLLGILTPEGYIFLPIANLGNISENEIFKDMVNYCNWFEIETFEGKNPDIGIMDDIFIVVLHHLNIDHRNKSQERSIKDKGKVNPYYTVKIQNYLKYLKGD